VIEERWLVYAVLSALFASFVGILGKIGMNEADSLLATTMRSIVMTFLLLAACTVMDGWGKLSTIQTRAFIAIILSGAAGATSWLCYFRAIKLGTVSQVVPIDKLSMPLAIVLAVVILGDRPTWLNWCGIILITIGAYFASISRSH